MYLKYTVASKDGRHSYSETIYEENISGYEQGHLNDDARTVTLNCVDHNEIPNPHMAFGWLESVCQSDYAPFFYFDYPDDMVVSFEKVDHSI